MRDRNKEIFFPLFALCVLFNAELFTTFFIITGVTLEKGFRTRQAILIAFISYLMMAVDFAKSQLNRRNIIQFGVLGLILTLYILTGLLHQYGYEHVLHRTYLLLYGSLCIPATYVGMRLAKGGYERRIIQFLPYFLLLIAFSIGYVVIFRATEGGILGRVEGDVTTYQGASYAMSFSCSYCLFWLFFAERNKGVMEKLLYWCVLVAAFVCGIGCIVGGGRGAFLHLVCSTGYIIWRILGRNSRRNGLSMYFMLAVCVIGMVYLSIRFNIFNSAGAIRVAENLTIDSSRDYTRYVAVNSFLRSPILGHGIGSVWWEVGFYSHNMLIDFLVETGFIGAIIMVATVSTMLIRLLRGSKSNSFDMFILLIMFAMLVEHTFSGYWMASSNMFLIFGYVYGKNSHRYGPYMRYEPYWQGSF